MGFQSYLEGRVASFFSNELVVGTFYHFFSLITLSYFIRKKHPGFLNFSLIILIISISFMIGERANFIKLFFSILLFVFLILRVNLIKKISIVVLTLLMVGTIFYLNDSLKKRYYNQISVIYSLDGFKKYFKESQYGAHQNTAYEIFKDNVFFGVGLKNFREESKKDIYENPEYKKTNERQATHPHQIHLELLSEIGLIGYILIFNFNFFLNYYFYKKLFN